MEDANGFEKSGSIDPLSYLEWSRIVAKRYSGRGLTLDDLEGEAAIGLLKACLKFDTGNGTRFEYYCELWIRREILSAIATNRIIRIPPIRFYEAKKAIKKLFTKKLSRTKQELLADAVYAFGLLQSGHEDTMENIIDHFDRDAESYDRTLALLNQIDSYQSEIIQLKLGLDGREPKSFEIIGKLYGVQGASIYYHYKKGLKALKTIIEEGQ